MYLFGWFPLDAVAMIPFDLISLLSKSDTLNHVKARIMVMVRVMVRVRVVVRVIVGIRSRIRVGWFPQPRPFNHIKAKYIAFII